MSETPDIAAAPVQAELDLKVRLPVFEGPLDLLLYLIRKEEIDIYQIPIEKITQQYLDTLRLMQLLDLEVAGEFLVMAATLLHIKSRMLLPQDQQPPLEEDEEEDPRWELIRQLVEYKKFKDAAHQLEIQNATQEKIFQPAFNPKSLNEQLQAAGAKGVEAGIFDLITAFQKVLARLQPKQESYTVMEERFTVSDKIIHVQQLLSQRERILFRDLFPEDAGRTEIVVTFLALLELIRLHQITAVQDEVFGEIQLVKAAPVYETPTPSEEEPGVDAVEVEPTPASAEDEIPDPVPDSSVPDSVPPEAEAP
ncbi:condensin subunit ScpA [Verrucomicrobium sp. GAS474]|uniref:segregation and condensation protein A n=1 Tax=Verrucomicrobium sp. GAS474 TaxID=1882831 RepID=UPI00087DA856|nr:segregation/condensation protein A [Verrucomicrobium sp. GAS474]SDT86219.1 condensin subunit ScpA [Verrucomicrobium sp. GAS474]